MAATIVLVPGAWAGAWIWEPLALELTSRGLAHRAVDLVTVGPGAAGRDARDDARHVRAVIDEVGGPVVLVGNSYGGVVISGASARNDKVRRLVFIAAMIPAAGESLLEHIAGATSAEFDGALVIREDGLIETDGDVELATAFNQATPEMQAYVRAHLGKLMSFGVDPVAALFDEVGWTTIPSTYIVCADDLSILPDAQRRWAKERATDVIEVPTDHCPQISHPELVADLLEELARAI